MSIGRGKKKKKKKKKEESLDDGAKSCGYLLTVDAYASLMSRRIATL